MSDCHESPVAPIPDGGPVVAIAGNPNAGKSTLFNALTGLRQHTGNWPGKTVARREGAWSRAGAKLRMVDLPGAYSLSAFTPEEVISRDFILEDRPAAVINVVDATNLERNLYLTVQLLELGAPVVVALNMTDELSIARDPRGRDAALGAARWHTRRPPFGSPRRWHRPADGRRHGARRHRRAETRPVIASAIVAGAPGAFRLDYGPDLEPEIDRLIAAFADARLRPGARPRPVAGAQAARGGGRPHRLRLGQAERRAGARPRRGARHAPAIRLRRRRRPHGGGPPVRVRERRRPRGRHPGRAQPPGSHPPDRRRPDPPLAGPADLLHRDVRRVPARHRRVRAVPRLGRRSDQRADRHARDDRAHRDRRAGLAAVARRRRDHRRRRRACSCSCPV